MAFLPDSRSCYAYVSDVAIYNNELYVAGDFNGGTGLCDIVKFNGTNWVSVGGGLSGFGTFIERMMVYQGELYVVGTFYTSNGNPGNCIAKWNGTSWSTFGSGLNAGGQLHCLIAFKNEIYVGGAFYNIGGVVSPFIAKWNGTNWNSLGSTFNNGVECFAVHDNDLYIGGAFITIGNDTMVSIARYSPPIAIEENSLDENGISISHTLTNGNFSISSIFYSIESIRLFDLTGKIIFSKDKIFKNTYECKLNSPDGIYVAEIFVNEKIYRRKLFVIR